MAVPGELAARWRAAEHQLYPLLLNDAGAYQRGVRAVRALADELGSLQSDEDLAAAFPAYAGPAGRAAELLGGDAAPSDLVAGAAFALRHRELAAELEAAAVAERIAAAARGGDQWVLLREVGRPEAALFGAYRRLEMHLGNGTGLHAFAELGDDGRPVFGVETVPLDPASGRPRGEAAERWETGDPAGWEAAQADLRAAIERRFAALDTVGRPGGG